MKKNYLLTLAISAIAAPLVAQVPFTPIDTNFVSNTVVVPAAPFQYDVLFRGDADMVFKNGQSILSKTNMDFSHYIPINGSSTHGHLIVNHEQNVKDPSGIIGDGGGMTVMEVQKGTDGHWSVVGNRKVVDFSSVRGTYTNCGGAPTPWNTVLTAEEYPPSSNLALSSGFSDTSNYTIPAGNGPFSGMTIPAYQNYGWMVEVNPVTASAVKKYYAMGNFSHEGGYCMPDQKTVYLTDDFTPAVFFKFVADVAGDYTEGQLYAYKQGANGQGGSWLTIPRDFNSVLNARNIALGMGATSFIRLEWVVGNSEGNIYLTETGIDDSGSGMKTALNNGATIAHHQWLLNHDGDTTFTDYYGRVLEFNPATNNMRVYINGGTNPGNTSMTLSNPDGLAITTIGGKEYMVINEDINGRTHNRVPAWAAAANRTICEVYVVDLSIDNPTLNDLKRFMTGSPGAETTGSIFTPDGLTHFVNIQHPSSSNPAPFNKSATLAMTGFEQFISGTGEVSFDQDKFHMYPNPASRMLHFSTSTDVVVINQLGQQILSENNVNLLDISALTPGQYFIKSTQGGVQKLIVQ